QRRQRAQRQGQSQGNRSDRVGVGVHFVEPRKQIVEGEMMVATRASVPAGETGGFSNTVYGLLRDVGLPW
ncbi:MAG: hypothetical protein MUE35_12170, partial [Hydrogenophaga sp.]|nr:hypothetical protein [Hydrogenophaga sp.]